MGRITVFALDTCPFCKKAKDLLSSKGASFEVISLTQTPDWRPLMYILTKGTANYKPQSLQLATYTRHHRSFKCA